MSDAALNFLHMSTQNLTIHEGKSCFARASPLYKILHENNFFFFKSRLRNVTRFLKVNN